MNKIKVVNDNLEKINVDDNVKIEYYEKECLFAINEIKLFITNDSDLQIEINLKEDTKLNFNINVKENVRLNLYILINGVRGKIQYKYNLLENSYCNVFKFQNSTIIKEMVIANLNGENARFDHNLKTICHEKGMYDYNIYHNSINTISNIKNNGVCIKNGFLTYQVSSFVPKNINGCMVSQNNRIINLTDNKCEIKPNLYIDCNDVEASHSAFIGNFSDEEMFYIQSRGINYTSALKLLITGFLTNDIVNNKILKEIKKNIEQHWR